MNLIDKSKNGPELWATITGKIEELWPGCTPVVAGGSVRDYMEKCDFKDIDVFITNYSEFDFEIEMDTLSNFGFTDLILFRDRQEQEMFNFGDEDGDTRWLEEYDFSENKEVFSIIECKYEGVPIQIVLRQFGTHADLIDTFDYSLVKCWWTPHQGLRTTKEYRESIKSKIITYTYPDKYYKTERRFNKWRNSRGKNEYKMKALSYEEAVLNGVPPLQRSSSNWLDEGFVMPSDVPPLVPWCNVQVSHRFSHQVMEARAQEEEGNG